MSIDKDLLDRLMEARTGDNYADMITRMHRKS